MSAALSLCWLIGFAFTWMSKWLLAASILGADMVRDVLQAVSIRSGMEEAGASRIDLVLEAWWLNLSRLIPWLPQTSWPSARLGAALAFSALSLVVIALAAVLVNASVKRSGTEAMRRRLPILAVAAIPLLWYALLPQHSVVHFWFTYRALSGTVFVVIAVLLAPLDRESA